ncbi:MAG: alpha/beta hydrolase [Acidimicrobiia bacterium]
MLETNINIPSGDINLAGTLTFPDGEGPYPTALLIAGSGPLDRDGNHKRMPLGVSRDLAAALCEVGWASVRYDKRGVGKSGGDYLSTGFYDELEDTIAALEWMLDRPTTATAVAIGHSVGATYAAELSASQPALDGAALLAYTAKTGEDTLKWQAVEISASIPRFATGLMSLFRTSVTKQQAKALDKLKATSDDVTRIQMQKVNAKWMREFIAYDPKPVLADTKAPLLAVTGSKDVQVDPDDIAIVAEVAGAEATAQVVPDVDHILRYEPADRSNPKKYKSQLKEPIDGRVMGLLEVWLQDLISENSSVADV